jgi:hypothetical protein
MQGRIKEGKKDKNQILETGGDVKIRGCKSPSIGEGNGIRTILVTRHHRYCDRQKQTPFSTLAQLTIE